MIKFEFDKNKSRNNLEKHGIDFHTAQQLWNDSELIEIPVNTSDEPRYLVIGLLNGKHWSGVITYRNSNIRIISVRRSRKTEVNLYESA
ncbi:BrnT family toxin [Rheinheimera sp. NSM]|uniref:BrnT family toxin n=1 Tax=Rheinheimera sp. NSM TaxID=3457884 RepID=UPI004035C6D9